MNITTYLSLIHIYNSKTIYLDNAATTFPKPESVYTEMDYVNRNLAVNTGRGSYSLARKATEIIDRTREKALKLVKGKDVADIEMCIRDR